MHIIPFKGRNLSAHYDLNLLFNDNKTYIMDNHLAASWCWMQKLNPSHKYNLFHIDRHYDLLSSQIDWWVEELKRKNFDFTRTSITNLLAIKYKRPDVESDEFPLFRWDNYLPIFNRLYPGLITAAYFATHKDGQTIDELEISEHEIYELPENLAYWITEDKIWKWIVNIDIDYFFTGNNGKHFQFLTDEYIKSIASELSAAWDSIEVLTIALSPELCGGWDNALRAVNLLTRNLPLSLDLDVA